MNKSNSYSSAGILPGKLLKMKDFCINPNGSIRPVHFQICPTNKCNLNCSFCSCSDRDKSQELNLFQAIGVIHQLSDLGAKAVTITGGGEPCCYPHLSQLLTSLTLFNIKIGMVTNGLLLHKVQDKLKYLTWCRVSASDYRDIDELLNILSDLVPNVPIDWAISYVITKDFDIEKFAKVVDFANKYNLTHVRAVSDLMNLEKVPDMTHIKMLLADREIHDSLVIYQDRQEYTKGDNLCWISLLKPLLAPDGYFYPCCGVQYALPVNQGNFPEKMRMFRHTELNDFYKKQTPFNGSVCKKCYYQGYNTVLQKMIECYNHPEFV